MSSSHASGEVRSDTAVNVRRYYRIPTILPVEYQLMSEQNEALDPEVRTGFTRDLSENGLCLQLRGLPQPLLERLERDATELRLATDIALPGRTLRLLSRVIWSRVLEKAGRRHRMVGVEFVSVKPQDADALVAFAKHAAARPKVRRAVTVGLAAALGLCLALMGWSRWQHARQLEAAEQRLAESNAEYRDVATELARLTAQMRSTSAEMSELAYALDRATRGYETAAVPAGGAVAQLGDEDLEPELIGSALDAVGLSMNKLRAVLSGRSGYRDQERSTETGSQSENKPKGDESTASSEEALQAPDVGPAETQAEGTPEPSTTAP